MDLRDPASGPLAVHFLSLGCPKNRLDTEVMIGSLALGGFPVAERIEDAGVAVVNTCSFIESAREESIQAILDVCDRKAEGELQAVIVAVRSVSASNPGSGSGRSTSSHRCPALSNLEQGCRWARVWR